MNLVKLKKEIDAWVTEGVITIEQSKKLYQRYKLSYNPVFYKESGFILKAVAIFLVGLALFLIIEENWSTLPLLAKGLVGLLPLLSLLILAIRSVLNKNEHNKTELLFFFSHLLIGLNIFLQTQIFEISLPNSVQLLAWSTITLIVTVFFKSRLNLFLLLLIITIFHWNQLSKNHLELQKNYFYWFSVPIFWVSGYLVYLNINRLNIVMGILNLFLCGVLIDRAFHGSDSLTTNITFLKFSSVSFLVLSALPWLHEKLNSSFLQKIKYSVYFLNLALFCFYFVNQEIHHITFARLPTLTSVVYFCLGLAVYVKTKQNLFLNITLSLLIHVFLLNIVGYYLLGDLDTPHTAWVGSINISFFIASNVIFFICCAVSVYHGLRDKMKDFFFTGVVMFLMLVFTHYVTRESEVFTTALFFLIFAGTIYYLNHVWSKKIMASVR